MTRIEWIEQVQKSSGLSIELFLKKINYTKTSFNAWKRGLNPGKNVMLSIQKTFNVPIPKEFHIPADSTHDNFFELDFIESKHRKWFYLPDILHVCPLNHCEWVSPDGKCHMPACLKGVKYAVKI